MANTSRTFWDSPLFSCSGKCVIPVAILRYIYGGVVNFVLGKFSVLQNILAFMPASEVFEVLIPVAVILGIGIGLIGSFFAVRKHADV